MFSSGPPNHCRTKSKKYYPYHHQSHYWFKNFMSHIHREFGKTSTFQILIIAILLHSILSIIMIYFHLVYYSDTYHSKHSSTHDHPNRGKIAVYSKKIGPDDIDSELKYKLSKIDYEDKKLFGPNSINLLVPKLIGSSENTFIGWFSDHQQWDEKFQCFNNRWTLCDKILFAQCQQNRLRSIFQFIPFKPNANIRHLYFSLRATAEQLVEQSNDAFYGLMALVQLVDGREHIVKYVFKYLF